MFLLGASSLPLLQARGGGHCLGTGTGELLRGLQSFFNPLVSQRQVHNFPTIELKWALFFGNTINRKKNSPSPFESFYCLERGIRSIFYYLYPCIWERQKGDKPFSGHWPEPLACARHRESSGRYIQLSRETHRKSLQKRCIRGGLEEWRVLPSWLPQPPQGHHMQEELTAASHRAGVQSKVILVGVKERKDRTGQCPLRVTHSA